MLSRFHKFDSLPLVGGGNPIRLVMYRFDIFNALAMTYGSSL